MIPIPLTWCLGGAGAALLLGAMGGWTVRDWKDDAAALAGLKKAEQTVADQRTVIAAAAQAYQENQQNGQIQTTIGEHTIREIYKNVPVRVDCAAPDAVRGVLDTAVAGANARAAGQPESGLPTSILPAAAAH